MPLTVSVIMPVYNQERFVAQAVESVLAQTYRDFELLVINDGSADQTMQVLDRYAGQIRLFSQDNAGPSAARNLGLYHARGELIAFLDGDDLWVPGMLAGAVQQLSASPQFEMVVGGWNTIDETGRGVGKAVNLVPYQEKPGFDLFRELALGNLFPIHALVVRRSCFDRWGGYDETLRAMEDWELWLRFAAGGCQALFIAPIFASYRRHSKCSTLKVEEMECAFQIILDRLFVDQVLARRLEGLREHAYLHQWLYLADLCQEAGFQAKAYRCIQNARQFLDYARPDPELNLRYLSIACGLQGSAAFVEAITAASPALSAYATWFTAERAYYRGEYRLVLANLARLMISHPLWLARKVIHRAIPL